MLYTQIQKALDEIQVKYQEKLSDDNVLSFFEAIKLIQDVIATLTKLVRQYAPYSDEEKQAAILQAFERFYDEVISPMDIKGVPNMLEPVVDKALKQMILVFAEPMIASMLNIFAKQGWGVESTTACCDDDCTEPCGGDGAETCDETCDTDGDGDCDQDHTADPYAGREEMRQLPEPGLHFEVF